jgi:hypothetical protein
MLGQPGSRTGVILFDRGPATGLTEMATCLFFAFLASLRAAQISRQHAKTQRRMVPPARVAVWRGGCLCSHKA